jgi:hypothetical protein
MEARTLVAWLEGENELDLERWRHRLVCGRRPGVPFGRRAELADQLEMLAEGFVGESVLLWVHAALNVALRRGLQPERNARRFLALWQGHADLLLEQLDARWLVSACDSFADVHPDPQQAALAASVSFLVNTVKLYETERQGSPGAPPAPPFPAAVSFRELFDGLTTFLPERGDMVANLVARLEAATARALQGSAPFPVVPALQRELVNRLLAHETVFQRARPLARFPWPPALAPLPRPAFAVAAAASEGLSPPPAAADGPGWLLLHDGSRLARGFHLGRLAAGQVLADGLARRGLVARGGLNDGAALQAQLAASPGQIRLLVLDAAGLRPDGERWSGLRQACLEARRRGVATAVIQAGGLWDDWEPFERAFLCPSRQTDVPQRLAPALVEDPALLLFEELLAALVPAGGERLPLAVVDSPDPALAPTLQGLAAGAAAPLRTMTAAALDRLRRQAPPVPAAWPRLLRTADLPRASLWLGDRSSALLAALCAEAAIAVPPGSTAAALALVQRYGLADLALLSPSWEAGDPAAAGQMLAERAAAWDDNTRTRLRQQRRQACAGIETMLDSLADLAGVPPYKLPMTAPHTPPASMQPWPTDGEPQP